MPSASPSQPLFTRERLVVAGLLLFTLVLRSGVLWGMQGNLQQDPDAYREIAENVLAHGVYGLGKASNGNDDPFGPTTPLRPTAYRPPLYPIVLSNLPAADGKHVSLALVAVVHVLLGVGTVWLTYLTARRIVGSSRREEPAAESTSSAALVPHGVRDLLSERDLPWLLATVLVACDPILLNQQSLVMTETLAAFLAILALWCLARFHDHRYWWNAGLAGGVIGLAALCRPTFLPWLGLVAALMIADCGLRIAEWRTRGLRSLANVAALAVVAAAVMSPWAIRNQQVFGKPILTTTHGGYTLWLGNNPSFFDWLRRDISGLPWDVKQGRAGDQIHKDGLTRLEVFVELIEANATDLPAEMFADRFDARIASRAIRNDPTGFAQACFYRIRQLWSPLPHKLTAEESTKRTLLRYSTATWYCGVYALAAVGICRLRWRLFRSPWVWGVLLCLTFTAVHTLYWCNLRMRAPLTPFVALVAGAALASIKPEAQAKESGENSP